MHIIKKHTFGEIEAYELGFGPIGRPVMTVFFYYIDGVFIDSGQSNMRKHVSQFFKEKRADIVLLTHHHEDHSANASLINRLHGAKVFGHPSMIEKMRTGFKIRPYQHLVWGRAEKVNVLPLPDFIETEHYKFVPVHTPGHSKDHTVYLEEKNGWLFSGDLYVADKIKFFRVDEKMRDQIESLKKILSYDFDALFCAHHPTPENGRAHLKRKLEFLEGFHGNVKELMLKGYSGKEIIKKLGNRSDWKTKWITMGNASFANMVRSAMLEGQD
ncbi:MAG: MBL fold metallo-hydrolase [Desulfobacterales bacterium]|nr:MBL fold metallo-hydrolase [Desulfobacterales bacterium]